MTAIDRQALVKRHNIVLNDHQLVLPLGNGEFCFNTDRTDLQTFSGNTMAYWAWYSVPLPEGVAEHDLPATDAMPGLAISTHLNSMKPILPDIALPHCL